MSTDPRTRSLSETCTQRGPNRPLHTKGGSPNYLEKSLAAAAEPFRGITNDGNVIAGLYGIQATGASTQAIREAAEAFLGSLNAEQRAKTLFPIDTDQWRKWSNIHPTLMRHGTPLFDMTDTQRDCAFALLRESLSQRLCDPCPTCSGHGTIRSTASIAYEVLRRIRREATMNAPLQRVGASVHPDVAAFLAEYEPAAVRELERELQVQISLRQSRELERGQYEVTGVAALPGTGSEKK